MSDAPGEIPGLFAIGVAAMLLPPIFLALCAAWLCSQDRRIRRSKAKIAEQEQGDDDSEGEEDALQPSRRDSWDNTSNQGQGQRRPVYFRQAEELCSCTHKPLVTKLALDHVHSVAELHDILHQAYEQLCARQRHDGITYRRGQEGTTTMVVEYRNTHARLVRVSKQTDLRNVLSNVKALYVTMAARALDSSGSSHSIGGLNCTVDVYRTASTDGDDDDENGSMVSDAASSVLVDLSLAGCCGVQSTCGGLVITGSVQSEPVLGERRHAQPRGKQTRASAR